MIDRERQQLNLEYLRQAYFDTDSTAKARSILAEVRTGGGPNLAYLLRDHTVEAVNAKETYQRDAFDFLLAYYGILEIASQIRYIPESLPEDFSAEAQWNLSHPAVRRYYEEFYSILLPRLFLMRLQSRLSLHEDLPDDPTPTHRLFNEFLGLVNRQRSDEAVETFLWFLDDGWRDDYNINDALKVLRDPKKLLNRLLRPPEKRDSLDLSVRGMQNFMNICIELDDLLQRSSSYRLFQSALWHYYAYWFDAIRDQVGNWAVEVVSQVQAWLPQKIDREQNPQAAQAINDYARNVGGVMVRLLSGEYGRTLRERVRDR